MTYSIVTSSKTGNTQAVADAIAAALPPEGCVYRGAPAPEALDADVIFAGFWTDKGTCAQDMAGFLPLCGGKKVALFGSYGWGDGQWMRDWADRLAASGAAASGEPLIVNEAPDDGGLAQCRALGAALAGV